MTEEEAIEFLTKISYALGTMAVEYLSEKDGEKMREAIKVLEQEPKIGHWMRMSDLSEQEDDRHKCSQCGNVIHHKNKLDLYTFNSWCGRCGSDNGGKWGKK